MKTTIVALAAPLMLLGLLSHNAWATSFSESQLGFPLFTEDSGPTSSLIFTGPPSAPTNLASSLIVPLNGAMGAKVFSDHTVGSVQTDATHNDDWSCSGSCAVVAPAIGATIGFDVTISAGLAAGNGEFDLSAEYTLGNDVFRIDANADSRPMGFGASFDGNSIPVTVITDPATGDVHLSVNFFRIVFPSSWNGQGSLPAFSDSQTMHIEMEGNGHIDGSHTFTVTLSSPDPNLVLTSADGRTIGTEPSASPIPEPASLLLVGTGLAAAVRRLRPR